jgi:hypothetical protein
MLNLIPYSVSKFIFLLDQQQRYRNTGDDIALLYCSSNCALFSTCGFLVLDIRGRWDKVLRLLQSKYGSQEGACLEWQHAADQLGRADSLLKQQSRS